MDMYTILIVLKDGKIWGVRKAAQFQKHLRPTELKMWEVNDGFDI